MNFRQRLAWLTVIGYLSATFGAFYYVFEISERYNAFALEHVENYHGKQSDQPSGIRQLFSLFRHITDIPLTVWIVILLLPYLQVFCILLACTKSEPKLSFALIWPGIFIIKCRKLYWKVTGLESHIMKPSPSAATVLNGHVIIEA